MIGDFTGADVAYRTVKGGYDQWVGALAKAYLEQPDTMIWTQNRLVRFERAPVTSRYRYQLTIGNDALNKQWRVYANYIVLAMPQRSLELLDQDTFFFTPAVKERISAVISETSFKLLMGFTEPWWREDFGAMAGKSTTDLPPRQCYYFGTDPDDSHCVHSRVER